jgi:signal transduction histidine kinase
MKRLLLVTRNRKLAASLQQLCELLSYSICVRSQMADALADSHNADLLVIDGMEQDITALMAQLQGLPHPFPVLWVLDQPVSLPRARCLYHPFTVEQAVQAIQRALFRPGLPEIRRAFLDAQFLADLLWADSEQQIIQRMTLYVAELLACPSVGVLLLDDDLRARWLDWFNPPDAALQAQLARTMLHGDALAEGWSRLVFNAQDVVGALFILKPALEPAQEKVVREILSVTLRVWGREVSLVQSKRHLDQMRTFEVLGQLIVAQLDARQALEIIVSSIRSLVNASGALVWLRREDHLVMAAHSGQPIPARQRISARPAPLQPVLQSSRPKLLTDDEAACFFPDQPRLRALSISLMLNNHNIGLMQALRQPDEAEFGTEDEWRLRSLASWAVIAINNSRLLYKAHQALARERQSRAKIIQLDKLTELGRLTAGIAHEINNALQAAYGALSSGIERGQMVGEDVEVLQATLDQIASVVQKVRTIYRPAGAEPQQSDINQIVAQVIDMLTWQIKNRAVTLVQRLSPQLPVIRAFPHELRQVVLNLMMNALDAVDAANKPDKRIDVETGFDADSERIYLCIRDNGIGMTEAQVTSIFEPFYTTKPDGSGLGLSICSEIVRRYGGHLEVNTHLGQGTSFTVWLPEQTPVEEHSLSRQAADLTTRLQNMRMDSL